MSLNFGVNLRKAREAAGLSYQEVSDDIGFIDSRSLGVVERKHTVSVKTLLKLCEIYNVKPSEMLESDFSCPDISFSDRLIKIPLTNEVIAGRINNLEKTTFKITDINRWKRGAHPRVKSYIKICRALDKIEEELNTNN